ncbi:hypothetical protein AMTRI_Chr10g231520 [Amborella trichopoda]
MTIKSITCLTNKNGLLPRHCPNKTDFITRLTDNNTGLLPTVLPTKTLLPRHSSSLLRTSTLTKLHCYFLSLNSQTPVLTFTKPAKVAAFTLKMEGQGLPFPLSKTKVKSLAPKIPFPLSKTTVKSLARSCSVFFHGSHQIPHFASGFGICF